MQRTIALSCAAALSLTLVACGGGGFAEVLGTPSISSETAQGWAADAQVMPVTAATTTETATRTLETAMATGTVVATAAPGAQALSAGTSQATVQAASFTLRCANGGTLAFTVNGGTTQQQLNGRMDAGEVYDVTFTNCGGATPGAVLDGGLTITVNAYTTTSADFTHTARALRFTDVRGVYTLDGTLREQRSTTALAGGSQRLSSRLSTPTGLTLQSRVSGRNSSYELQQLDWTAVCTVDASGQPTARSHQGTLAIAVRTPRRPSATLQVATQGSMTLGDDGMTSQGSFSITTSDDRVSVTYSDSGVSIALDLGNNGTVERRWTMTRLAFIAEAG